MQGKEQLCLGGVADSYPPQCSGLPLVDWRWDVVKGEETASGTTWGDFHVEGTYDGSSLTVLEAGPFEPPTTDYPDYTPPCPEPAGGWAAVDPSRATDADLQAVTAAAERQPDFAGFWIDYVEKPSESPPQGGIIAVAAFTGDLERHEAELRSLWGGPLCVTQHERSQAELSRIMHELRELGLQLGLQILQAWDDVTRNTVHIEAVVVSEDARSAIEDRYGESVVELDAALTPVEGSYPSAVAGGSASPTASTG